MCRHVAVDGMDRQKLLHVQCTRPWTTRSTSSPAAETERSHVRNGSAVSTYYLLCLALLASLRSRLTVLSASSYVVFDHEQQQ